MCRVVLEDTRFGFKCHAVSGNDSSHAQQPGIIAWMCNKSWYKTRHLVQRSNLITMNIALYQMTCETHMCMSNDDFHVWNSKWKHIAVRVACSVYWQWLVYSGNRWLVYAVTLALLKNRYFVQLAGYQAFNFNCGEMNSYQSVDHYHQKHISGDLCFNVLHGLDWQCKFIRRNIVWPLHQWRQAYI